MISIFGASISAIVGLAVREDVLSMLAQKEQSRLKAIKALKKVKVLRFMGRP